MKSRNTNDELMKNLGRLKMELGKIKASHVSLENHLSDSQSLYEDEIARLKRLISELSSDKTNEMNDFLEQLKDINDSVGNKVLFGSELAAYRKMLESEEVRVGLGDECSSPPCKRMKTTTTVSRM